MLVVTAIRLLWGLNWYASGSVAVATVEMPLHRFAVPPTAAPEAWRRAEEILAASGVAEAGLGRSGTVVNLVRCVLDRLLAHIDAPSGKEIELSAEAERRAWDVAVALENPATAGLAIRTAVDIVAAALEKAPLVASPASAEALVRLAASWEPWRLDLDNAEIIAAARRIGLPWKRLSYLPSGIQLGEGRHQRRMVASMTDTTSLLAAMLARDKVATSLRLAQQGVPVARQFAVEQPRDAERAAELLGFPFVLKPRDGRWNRGVSIVYFPEDIAPAVGQAGENGRGIVAESYTPGREYRILVAAGGVCGAHERIAPTVVGDGRSTVAELVEKANADPAQLAPPGAWGAPIVITAMALAHLRWQGLGPDAIPAAGRRVGVSPLPFRKYGGIYRDASELVHPANADLATRIARSLWLDVAGIDIRMVDIARPWSEGPAGVCEVNSGPGLDNIAITGRAAGIDIPRRLVDRIHPPSARRIMPAVLLTGLADIAGVAARVAQYLAERFGWTVGLATSDGASVGTYRLPPTTLPGARPGLALIAEDPDADACVAGFGLATLLDHGLGRDRFDVAVVGDTVEGLSPAHAAALRRLLARSGCVLVDATGDGAPERVGAELGRLLRSGPDLTA